MNKVENKSDFYAAYIREMSELDFSEDYIAKELAHISFALYLLREAEKQEEKK